MAVLDLITLAELKSYRAIAGTGRDTQLRRFITVASLAVERELGRRLIYRAPPEISTKDNVLASTAFANGAIAGGSITQPNAAGRTLIVTVADPGGTLTAGTITITGTVAGGASKTVVFDVTNGLEQHGVDFFTGALAITIAAVSGGDANTKLTVGTSLGYVEYHSLDGCESRLFPYEWPVQSVLLVNEDPTNTYGSSTDLDASSYIITPDSPEGGYLTRIYGTQAFAWFGGRRVVKLIDAAGYANAGHAPEDIKDVCSRLAVTLYEEVDRGQLGMHGRSDALGNWTRFGAAKITAEMKSQLGAYYRRRFGTDTGERDFDLEAA